MICHYGKQNDSPKLAMTKEQVLHILTYKQNQ